MASEIIITPNIWTEVDNLCNNISGEDRFKYFQFVESFQKDTIENYYKTEKSIQFDSYQSIGLSDSIIVEIPKECDMLITGDSELSDFAKAYNIEVLDLKAEVNYRINQ